MAFGNFWGITDEGQGYPDGYQGQPGAGNSFPQQEGGESQTIPGPALPASSGGGVPDLGLWSMPSFNGSAGPTFNIPGAPTFNAPQFKAPTMEDAQNEPGYQFRLGAGKDMLEKAAAAKGLLRTGGTLKDLLSYGQNFAAQEYNNVYKRALDAHQANYRAAYDAFAPQLQEWSFLANLEKTRGMAAFQREWEQYEANARSAQARNNAILQAAQL